MFYKIKGGRKITVGEGFECWLPPIPDKHDILFYNLPKEEQYWRRLPLPAFYEERRLEELYIQNQELEMVLNGQKKAVTHVDPVLEKYRRKEWHRRLYGCYFMNNGDPTYLTNHHYFYLQHSKYDHPENGGYPFYYEFSRDNFYIRSWCENNPKSMGYMFIGPRATGKSNEEIASIVNRATYFHNHRAALQSKHFENDAKGVLIQAKTVPLFNALPDFFKPEFAHGTNPQEVLLFQRDTKGGKAAKNVKFGPDYDLLSTIFAAMPGVKALDSDTLSDLFEDEIGKQHPKKVGDIYERHEVNLKCVFRNHRKIGVLRKTSTVEEMNEGGDECFKLWKDSNPEILDGNGFTTSKIHRHLISALDTDTSLEEYIDQAGKNWGAPCNKYGQVDRKTANVKIQNDFDAVKHDLKKLSGRMRKNPRNETEAFIPDQSKSIFNVQLITNRLNFLRNELRKPLYVTGNLFPLTKDKFGPVGFQIDEHAGRFNWAWFPDEFRSVSDPDKWRLLNNVGEEIGFDYKGNSRTLKYPKNDHLFRLGTDPIKFTKTKDPRASRAGAHGFRLWDWAVDANKPRSQWESHNFIFEYINRPEDPETYSEDMALACIFLGAKILPERNVPTLNDYFERNGLERFLAYPRDFVRGRAELSKSDEKNEASYKLNKNENGLDIQTQSDDAGYASTPEVIDYYTKRLITFINKDIDRFPFDKTLEDFLNFDPTNPTKSDATVSAGFTLIHTEKIAEEEEVNEESVYQWFDAVDNTGQVGRFIDEEELETYD